MPFDTSNDYSPFDSVGSGESGTVEGLLPLDGPASAFRYRKQIIVNVFVDLGFGIGFKDITGKWKVRVRADASKNADGSYAGEILFEQEMQWTARVVVLNLGVALVSWQALGDAGSGKQFTSIAAGEPCALYDISDEEKQAAYGESGAWRFVDRRAQANATPAQKYDFEKGFSIFTSEGAATVGSYQFFAVYQSQDYLCDIPEGGILETVFDNWAIGTLDSESAYTVSFKAGDEKSHCVQHPELGKTWFFYARDGDIRVARTRLQRGYSQSAGDPIVREKAKIVLAWRVGATLVSASIGQGGSALAFGASRNDGQSWQTDATVQISDIKILVEAVSDNGARGYFIGTATADSTAADATDITKGDLVAVIVKYDAQKGTFIESSRAKVGGDLPAKGVKLSRLFVDDGTLRLIGFSKTDVLWWQSQDDLKTLAQLQAPDNVASP